MLAIERKIDFFVLATLIVSCGRRGNALVLGSHEKISENVAEEYGKSLVEKNIIGRNSGT